MPQQIARNSSLSDYSAKCVHFGCPGGNGLSPKFHSVFDGAPFGPQGCPRAAPGSPPVCFFIDFGKNLCTCRAPGDAFSEVLGSRCAPHSIQNQAEYRVKNFPGKPGKKNTIAAPFPGHQEKISTIPGKFIHSASLSAVAGVWACPLDIYIYIYI